MKWVKYLQRTPLAQIRADWAEYMKLRRQCSAMHNAQRDAYNRIVTIVNGDEKEICKPSCVYHHYYTSPFGTNNNYDSLTNNMIWIRYSVCRKFDEYKNTVKCTKTDCPSVHANHEYADACERLNLMRQAQRDFWRVKFAQACQRTK